MIISEEEIINAFNQEKQRLIDAVLRLNSIQGKYIKIPFLIRGIGFILARWDTEKQVFDKLIYEKYEQNPDEYSEKVETKEIDI